MEIYFLAVWRLEAEMKVSAGLVLSEASLLGGILPVSTLYTCPCSNFLFL